MERLNKACRFGAALGVIIGLSTLFGCQSPTVNASQARPFDGAWNCADNSSQLNFDFKGLNIKLNKPVMDEFLIPDCIPKTTPTTLLIDFNPNPPARPVEENGFDHEERIFGLLDNLSPTTSPANITGFTIEVQGIKDFLKEHGEIAITCELNNSSCLIEMTDFETALNVVTFHALAGHALPYESDMTYQQAIDTEEKAYHLTKIYYDELMKTGKKILSCSGSCATP